MKILKTILLVDLLLVITLIASCTQLAGIVETPSSLTPTSLASKVSPTLTTTPVIKAIPTLTFTPVAVPTLPPEQASTKLLQLLTDNGGCHLPCLWGITPGDSTYNDAHAILGTLTGISDLPVSFNPEGGAIFPVYKDGDLILFTTASFNTSLISDSRVVSMISFKAQEAQKIVKNNDVSFHDVFDSALFSNRVRPYTMSEILSTQGMPTAVMISTDGGPERGKDVGGFYIVLIYPDQGLFVHYTTYRQLSDGNVQGCPANAHIELELFSSGDRDTFSEMLAQTQWQNIWPIIPNNPVWKPIEKATSMSLEQFYATFRQPTDKCIETPASIWPTPAK